MKAKNKVVRRIVSIADSIKFDVDDIVSYRGNGRVWQVTLASGDAISLTREQMAALEPLMEGR